MTAPPADSPAPQGPARATGVGREAAPRDWGGVARLVEAVVLLGSLAYAIVFWLRLPGQLPSDEDYLALQAAFQRESRPGDGAAVLPAYAERAKVYLHGAPFLSLPDLPTEPDAERFSRLWVIAQPSLPRSNARSKLDELARRLDAVGAPRRFGPLELWLFEPKPGRAATYDFIAHAREAAVQSQSSIGLEWREFDFLPRRCLLSRGGQATLRFEQVSLLHGVRLGIGALGDGVASVAATVDGTDLPPLNFVPGGSAFQSAELRFEAPAGPVHTVILKLDGHGACADAVAF